jgi:hypothetical protein
MRSSAARVRLLFALLIFSFLPLINQFAIPELSQSLLNSKLNHS